MDRRQFVAGAACVALLPALPKISQASSGYSDEDYYQDHLRIMKRVWSLWRGGMAWDDAFALSAREHGEDEAVTAFSLCIVRQDRRWDFYRLEHAADIHLAPHVRFDPWTRKSLQWSMRDDLEAFLGDLQTKNPDELQAQYEPLLYKSFWCNLRWKLAANWQARGVPVPYADWAPQVTAGVVPGSGAWWVMRTARSYLGVA